MMKRVPAAVGIAWSAVGIGSLVETVLTPGSAIRAFGRSIAFTGPRAETVVLTVLGMSVGATLAVSAAWVLQTRRASSSRNERERHDEQRTISEAGVAAKNDLLSWRAGDLQRQVDILLAKRDELLGELSDLAAKAMDLRSKARKSEKALARLSHEAVAMPDLAALEDRS